MLTVSFIYPFGTYENWIIYGIYLLYVYTILKFKRTRLKDEVMGKTILFDYTVTYFHCQGGLKESEKFQLEVIQLRKEMLGEEDPSTLTSIANLVSTYRNQGRREEAEKLDV